MRPTLPTDFLKRLCEAPQKDAKKTLRIFFAIMLPESVQETFQNILDMIQTSILEQSVRLVNAKQLHVTLQFLGNIQQNHLPILIEQARSQLKNISAFQLQVKILLTFPTKTHTKVIALSVEPQTELITLSKTLGQIIRNLGYPIDPRPFQGHITLARMKNDFLRDDLLSKICLPKTPVIEVNEIALMESKTNHQSAEYYYLDRFALRG